MNRRRFLAFGGAGLSSLALAGCATTVSAPPQRTGVQAKAAVPPEVLAMYGPLPNEKFPVPAVRIWNVPAQFWRQQVDYSTPYPVGTVIVDTGTYFLHLVQEGGKALRYGVGLGRAGFSWSGQGVIQWKRPWPTWTPPDEMIAREPELEKWSVRNGGMPPGLDNPLGARALYIFQDGRDTLYRIHGSSEYLSIGKAVSSGCVRLLNQDVVDLYSRVPPGSTLIVV